MSWRERSLLEDGSRWGRLAVRLLAVSICVGGLSGCWPPTSLHPFYLDEQVIFEPALLGRWVDNDTTSAEWLFERKGETAYTMTVPSSDDPDGDVYRSEGHLFRLGDVTLLDIEADEPPDSEASRFSPYPVIAAHTLLLVELRADTLRISMLHPDWWESRLEREPKSLRHEVVTHTGPGQEDDLVLTAGTEEIQAFLREELRRGPAGLGHLFDGDAMVLVRRTRDR